MAERRVVVTGAAGRLGRALRAYLPRADYRPKDELDVTDEAAVDAALRDAAVVVHAAALTNVDACEARPDEAFAVNTEGTRHVAAAARRRGAKVLLVSTDYVFAGDDPPYREDDARRPLNVYGRTKRAAEDALDRERDLVVRTSWLFGDGDNFVQTMLRAARTRTPRVVDDQVGRPTAAPDLARAIAFLAGEPRLTGRGHVAGDGRPCSRADLADLALQSAGMDVRVERVDSETYAATSEDPVAPRPPNSTLDLTRARSWGVPLADWRASLDRYVRGSA